MGTRFKLAVTQDVEEPQQRGPADKLWRALYGWVWIGYLLVIGLGAMWLLL